mgnify:CR=1 FL=1
MSKALILKNAAPRFEPQVRITFSTFICASLPHRIIAKRTKGEIIMKAKLLVGFLLTMTLFFILMPTTVSAAAGYEYRDENGQLQSTGDAAVSSMTADTAALSNGWYIVDSNISQYGTIAVSGRTNGTSVLFWIMRISSASQSTSSKVRLAMSHGLSPVKNRSVAIA